MTFEQIIAILGLIGGILTVWQNLNLKVKEIETKLKGIENQITEIKEERVEVARMLEKSNDKLWAKLDSIETKIDSKFEEMTVLQTEHKNNKFICDYIAEKKAQGK